VILLVSALAVVVLPRQFFMGWRRRAIRTTSIARFGLAAYIATMAAMILPIALAGLVALPRDALPDLFVLRIPLPVTWAGR
jgi:hypothetical protein